MGPKRTSDASASTQGEANPSDDVGDVSTTLAAQLAELRALFEASLAETRAVAEQALARATGEDAGSDGTPNVDDEKEHTSSAEKAEKAKELGTATDNANSKEEGKDDDAGELEYEDDGSGVEPATDNPFPRPPGHGSIDEPMLFDLRQELTYSSFRLAAQQRKDLARDPRRQEYRFLYTSLSQLYDVIVAMEEQGEELEPGSLERLNAIRNMRTLSNVYEPLTDRAALIQLWIELQAEPEAYGEGPELLAYVERRTLGFGDGMRLPSSRVQDHVDMFREELGTKVLKALAETAAKKRPPRSTLLKGDGDVDASKRKEKEKARKQRQKDRKAAATAAEKERSKVAAAEKEKTAPPKTDQVPPKPGTAGGKPI